MDSISLLKTVYEALSLLGWCSAMVKEMQTLDDNSPLNLVKLLVGKKTIGYRWVFVVKVNLDGSVARLIARLVAKGYAQTYGMDYYDTFSPISKMTYVLLFISLATTYNWDLH